MTNCRRYSTGTGGGGCDIVTCTVWWCMVAVVFFSRAMVHILNVCIVICTEWRWWWQSFPSRNACGGRNIVTCTVWWW